jgi:hypothetical protein
MRHTTLAPLARALVLASFAALSAACQTQDRPPAAPASPTFVAGARVMVDRGPSAPPTAAVVLRETGPGQVLVRSDAGLEEIVSTARLRDASAMPAAPEFRVGERLLLGIPQQRRVVIAEVLGFGPGPTGAPMYRVRYDGFVPEAVETVGAERLRRAYNGPSAFQVGQRVTMTTNGRELPGAVVALVGPQHWLVRFDGFGAPYDQLATAEQLRVYTPPAAPSPPPAPVEPVAVDPKDPKGAKPIMAGEQVLVPHLGAYHPGTVSGPGTRAGTFRVKYDDAKNVPEEDVAPASIVRAPPTPRTHVFAGGQSVFVEFHGMYVPGKVVKEAGKGLFQVRFEGKGPEGNEVVAAKRLRPRP